MRWSRLFIPTLRESPAGAEGIAFPLMLRAGYLRQYAPGSYTYLPLGWRALLKIVRIVREEMDAIGGQEFLLPGLKPAEPAKASGHLTSVPHEEVMAAAARGDLRSYKQLPQTWYHFHTRLRGAAQFLEQEACTFDLNAPGLDASCRKLQASYRRILDRCGLDPRLVESGAESHAFAVESSAGETSIVVCPGCGYSASSEYAHAEPVAPAVPDPEGDFAPEEFHTPGRKTIADVSEFTGLPQSSQMKSLVLVANGKLVVALVRGDHQLSEAKFAGIVHDPEFRPARPDEIREAFGADVGSLGPVGVTRAAILADNALKGRVNMIAGANKDDYHLRNVTPGKDFQAEFEDLRQVEAEDACSECGSPLEIRRAAEIARMRKVGPLYAESAGLRVTGMEGGEVSPLMGSYGVAIDRILAAAIERNHDQDGITLPASIAPFAVVITPVNIADAAQKAAAEEIYAACLAAGLDAVLDDRDERPGVKFKDSDLVGVPLRITVGKKLSNGTVELVERRGRKSTDVPLAGAATAIAARMAGGPSGA